MTPRHCIETLSWEAAFSHARLAHAQQDRLSAFVHKYAIPCLRERFDAFSLAGEVWMVDRLEVDIGQLSLKESPHQWLQQFDAALQRSLVGLKAPGAMAMPTTPSAMRETPLRRQTGQRRSTAAHEMGQFLHYLQHGVLPWGLPLRSARNLAGWLERLARQHGQRLWQELQQLMPPEPVLARLAQIAPHMGLQALLAVRHRDLADGMLLLDDAWLLPLQRRGRLSAYQVQVLQQKLRVAGLHTLWGLSGGALGGARQRALLAALRAAHTDALGPGWASLGRSLQGQALPRQPGSELASAMLYALLHIEHAAPSPRHAGPNPADAGRGVGVSPHLAQVALRRLNTHIQACADGRSSGTSAAQLRTWFMQLRHYAPAALAHSLRAQLRRRSGRRAWSVALPADQHWALLSVLEGPRNRGGDAFADGPGAYSLSGSQRPAPPQWADSLRQTALQLVQQCPAGARPGLSDMQSLLMQASLAYLLEYGRLPATHSAWLALWRTAWHSQAQPEDGSIHHRGHNHAAATDLLPLHTAPVDAGRSALPVRARRLSTPTYAVVGLFQLTWLPALVARWQPPAQSPRPASGASGVAAPPGQPVPIATIAWPAAALRRWLWQEAERYAHAHATPLTPMALQNHWERTWLALQRSAHDAALAEVPCADADQKPGSDDAPTLPSQGDPQAVKQQLHALWLQCAQGAWGPTQRLALARLLEQPDHCAIWCVRFSESQRWQWLRAQFGPVSHTLRQCADDLLTQLLHRMHATQPVPQGDKAVAPAAAAVLSPAVLARHWALLCEHLFVLAGAAQPAALRDHYLAAMEPPASSLAESPRGASKPSPLPSKSARQRSPLPAAGGELAADPLPAISRAPTLEPTPAPAPAGPQGSAWPPIWLDDAGQVLLSVYLERLFKHLGLVQAGRFVDAHAQARGVLCLQALVRGEMPSSEPFWPLSKLLCGVAPGALMPSCPPLNDQEHGLLTQLLGAVITHWKAIGNTSVAGLRESFLQREGRLERQDTAHGEPQAWRLKVQPRAFDMLLDRLPWGFSVIKLPWMQGVLYVEWR